MTPEQVVGKVFDVPWHLVDDQTSNATVSEWDSLGHMTLILELETVYGVTLSAEDALALTSVETIKRLLTERGVRW
jgi:acyl carrier protein